MLTTNDVAKVFETILSIPGMNDNVKIEMRISRKNALLLNDVILQGLSHCKDQDSVSLLGHVTEENRNELKSLANDCLQKAGLIELSEKLLSLNKK